MIAVILQGRLNSTRLPGKSLLPLGGEALIFRVMEALKTIPCDMHILACPESCMTSFSPLAEKAGFKICSGPEDDVLKRYCIAIKQYGPDRIIRATADNPFVFCDAAAVLAEEAAKLGADYAGYSGIPLGTGVEIVKSDALFKAEQESTKIEEREHVCPYLYNNAGLFRLHRPLAPPKWCLTPNFRLTVDTQEDYSHAEALYRRLSETTSGTERYLGATILGAAA